MEGVVVKHETQTLGAPERKAFGQRPIAVIDLDSSDESDSEIEDGEENGAGSRKRSTGYEGESSNKKRRLVDAAVVLPLGFLDPLPPEERLLLPEPQPEPIAEAPLVEVSGPSSVSGCKQFWKAGDYEGDIVGNGGSGSVWAGMDHVRVHPKFLHSNATSHKWALGAFAELLDNSLDEACNGATFVNIDMFQNKKDKSKMLLVEDNGGGMDPDRMRKCMSLGYSAKSKSANTIGQYGNGFKTSTMRLGADVIVFSRCRGKDGNSPTQTIGLLSYTFLRSTGKEDIVVPMLDYEKEGKGWESMVRSSGADWNKNLETIVQWSPFYSEDDLLQQFNSIEDQGTRIIIYNLWEDDHGELELDFSADPHDIQIRGVNRDEKKIQMAKQFPNSRHFLTYRHSLRSYVSILYLRLPLGFRITLRGKDVDHHNIVNDMMFIQEITYRPQPGADGVVKDSNMVAVVTVGFVKDAREHVDVQGFNVYHKNRLIKPFWRVWNAAGSDGRGVLGVLEANFVEPAHDKQGFERTTVLQRLEMRLVQMQKTYWTNNCEKIGYASRRHRKQESPPEAPRPDTDKGQSSKVSNLKHVNGHLSNGVENGMTSRSGKKTLSSPLSSGDESDEDHLPEIEKATPAQKSSQKETSRTPRTPSQSGKEQHLNGSNRSLVQLVADNLELKNKNKRLEARINELEQKLEEASKEQEALIDIFSEERIRRDKEEESLRKKLKDASAAIQDLLEKVRLNSNSIKRER
ncbi:protein MICRORCHIDIA 7-like [Aristolochia californica]|uniref:protein MICRORCHIDIA 7-like n=1 Tax=Aristolochia californica TaxID=171875 RepID=UPI0035D6DD84